MPKKTVAGDTQHQSKWTAQMESIKIGMIVKAKSTDNTKSGSRFAVLENNKEMDLETPKSEGGINAEDNGEDSRASREADSRIQADMEIQGDSVDEGEEVIKETQPNGPAKGYDRRKGKSTARALEEGGP